MIRGHGPRSSGDEGDGRFTLEAKARVTYYEEQAEAANSCTSLVA